MSTPPNWRFLAESIPRPIMFAITIFLSAILFLQAERMGEALGKALFNLLR